MIFTRPLRASFSAICSVWLSASRQRRYISPLSSRLFSLLTCISSSLASPQTEMRVPMLKLSEALTCFRSACLMQRKMKYMPAAEKKAIIALISTIHPSPINYEEGTYCVKEAFSDIRLWRSRGSWRNLREYLRRQAVLPCRRPRVQGR